MTDSTISPDEIYALVRERVFAEDESARTQAHNRIRELAAEQGLTLSSIQGLYEAAGEKFYHGITVPAINIRGLAYDTARAVFRAALRGKVQALIFEIARSEIGYTLQRPSEYVDCILAAALCEGFSGPVFFQGDHYQVNRSKYGTEPEKELEAIKSLIKESVEAGFYNIDVDASTLVDLSKETLEGQQELNGAVTAEMTAFIREIEPAGITVSVGGEIGEIGRGNSTPEDLRAYMSVYKQKLGDTLKGISKISVQTGTTHGGVVMPDGGIADVMLDFNTLQELSQIARDEYGIGGAVQHGASTLPDEAFDMFPKVGTLEVHLATGFQNIILDSPQFPEELMSRIKSHLSSAYASEKKEGQTDEQFFYKTRKRSFGDFKKEIWDIPENDREEIGKTLEERFFMLFQKLNVLNTRELISRYIV